MVKEIVLVTGSQGFIGSYICQELLDQNYRVVGIDNFSKYGLVVRPHDKHPNFHFIEEDVQNISKIKDLWNMDFDYIISLAAMIGGISYFHKYAYDLLATNERILASIFDYAIFRLNEGHLKRIINVSSSMVFESSTVFPTSEHEIKFCPPPLSTYGFQKLASEYFCKGAHEQYGLPYTIIRPFNCVGVGENEALADKIEGNTTMMLSHVLPDLIKRAIKLGPGVPLPILGSGEQLRCYTNGKDIARAVRQLMENPLAENEDYNISYPHACSVKELASVIYKVLYGTTDVTFTHLPSFLYDVQTRIPNVQKAKDLGVTCDIPYENSVREVVEWLKGEST
jgi:nucleoside-diphosphate-sugar epimerase